MAIKVKLNLPEDKNIDEFQDRMCFAIAKTLTESKSKEYIKELQKMLLKEG